MDISVISKQLSYFDPGVIRLNPATSNVAIASAETLLAIRFPPSLHRFLAWHNGGFIVADELYGVPPVQNSIDVVAETTRWRAGREHLWSAGYLPVSADGCGNPFVIATERADERGESPVVFIDGISLEVEAVVASDYMSFVWFLISDLIRVRRPNGEYLPKDHLEGMEPYWATSWFQRRDFLLDHDPDVAKWLPVFELH